MERPDAEASTASTITGKLGLDEEVGRLAAIDPIEQ
jgi:hypothetical protein